MSEQPDRGGPWPVLDPRELLRCLSGGGVDYVVIGGIAVVLLGSARMTRDLDLVFADNRENRAALGSVLVELGAKLRGVDEPLPFVADADTLGRIEMLTLETDAGWLDVHRVLSAGAPDYGTLRANADPMEIGEHRVLVASIEDMIAMKESVRRPQDLADAAELRAIAQLRGEQR